jgi:hypothetical protein
VVSKSKQLNTKFFFLTIRTKNLMKNTIKPNQKYNFLRSFSKKCILDLSLKILKLTLILNIIVVFFKSANVHSSTSFTTRNSKNESLIDVSLNESNVTYKNETNEKKICNNSDYKFLLSYDYKFFNEINMYENILAFHKSCFRDNKQSIKYFKSFHSDYEKFSNIDLEKNCNKQELIDKLLFELLNIEEIFPIDLIDKINQVCNNKIRTESPVNTALKVNSKSILFNKKYKKLYDIYDEKEYKLNEYLQNNISDKLHLLASFKHDLCGNMFKNSIKKSHLERDILKIYSNKINIPRVKVKKPGFSKKFQTDASLNSATIRQTLNQYSRESNIQIPYSTSSKAAHLNETIDSSYTIQNDFRSLKLLYNNKNSWPTNYISNNNIRIINATTDSNANTNINKNSNFIRYASKNYSHEEMLRESAQNESLIEIKEDIRTLRDEAFLLNNSKTILNTVKTEFINNCTLLLLNLYLVISKTNCDFDEFIENLKHYDCVSNYFSVKSDCDKCQVNFLNCFSIYL